MSVSKTVALSYEVWILSLVGFSDREGWLQVNDRGVRTIIPGGKSLSDQASEKDPPPMVRPDVGADTVEETRDQNVPMMPKPPIKVRLACFFNFILANSIESVNYLVSTALFPNLVIMSHFDFDNSLYTDF